LEYKEPETKKQASEDEKIDKSALRRARTVSFLRPLSDVSTRSDTALSESIESKRSSATSSRRASRPPSLSYSRTSSVASISSELVEPPSGSHPSRLPQASTSSQWEAQGAVPDAATVSGKRGSRLFEPPVADSISEELIPASVDLTTDQIPSPAKPGSLLASEFKIPEGYMLVPIGSEAATNPATCTCGCHETPLALRTTASYVSTSVQTDDVPSPPRTALRIDTAATSHWSSDEITAVSQANMSPAYDDYYAENPIFMGRMMNYFSKPGYQLGDSLSSSYHSYEPLVYQYQDTFDSDALHIRY
jgi:hypothetical protein